MNTDGGPSKEVIVFPHVISDRSVCTPPPHHTDGLFPRVRVRQTCPVPSLEKLPLVIIAASRTFAPTSPNGKSDYLFSHRSCRPRSCDRTTPHNHRTLVDLTHPLSPLTGLSGASEHEALGVIMSTVLTLCMNTVRKSTA